MTHKATQRRIAAELTPDERPADQAPPAGLAEAIKREIPETLRLHPDVAAGRVAAPAAPSRFPSRRLLAAASVVAIVGAGVVAYQVLQVTPDPTREPVSAGRVAVPQEPPARSVENAPEVAASHAAVAVPDDRARSEVATGGEAAGAADEAGKGSQAESYSLGLTLPSATGARSERDARALDPATPPGRKIAIPDPTPDEPEAAVDVSSVITVVSESPLLDSRGAAAPAASDAENPFAVDGVVIVDSESAGSSPSYRDLDQFEELAAKTRPGEVPKPTMSPPPPPPPPPPPAPPPPSAMGVRENRQIAPMRAEQRRLEEELRRLQGPGMAPSTGGTAEPNDQPYGDVFFRAYGTNPFIDTEDDRLSTFALDVDTGSYTVARRYLTDGHLPPPEAVRVEEMVNAFDYGDPPPPRGRRGGDFALYAEGARSPFTPTAAESYRVVRFAVAARALGAEERKPAVLTFVVDVSGSMSIESRLGLVKQSLRLLLEHLRADDRVGLVVYGSRGHVLLEPTADHAAIGRAIDRLVSEGSTNAEEGLTLAYDLARRHYREGAINRLILCSDGVANVGATGPESILERIGREARSGIELTTVGFGMGNYNDVLMEQLADRGDGAYAYVDTLAEARRIFVENLTGTLQTVARDAKIQVEFDPEVVARWRLIGYENRDVPDEKFRDDTVDAGEVGAGHKVTALYEIKLADRAAPGRHAAVVRLRYRSADSGEVREVARPLAVRDLDRSWGEAPRSLQLAAIVAELGEVLKGSYWAKDADLDGLLRRAQAVSARYPGDARVAELAALVGKVAQLRRAGE